MNKGELVTAVVLSLPTPEPRDFDVDSAKDAIYFTWGASRKKFKVSESGFVEEVDGRMVVGTDIASLIQTLIAKTVVALADEKRGKHQQ